MASKSTKRLPSKGSEFWSEHIQAWEQSKLNKTEYCQQNNLSRQAFYYWLKRLKSENGQFSKNSVVSLPFTIQDLSKRHSGAIVLKIGSKFQTPKTLQPGGAIVQCYWSKFRGRLMKPGFVYLLSYFSAYLTTQWPHISHYHTKRHNNYRSWIVMVYQIYSLNWGGSRGGSPGWRLYGQDCYFTDRTCARTWYMKYQPPRSTRYKALPSVGCSPDYLYSHNQTSQSTSPWHFRTYHICPSHCCLSSYFVIT